MTADGCSSSDKVHCMEVFCDSHWGGHVTGKSAASAVVLLDGVVVYSYHRSRKSSALSSCEAEVLAPTSAGSEVLFLKACWHCLGVKKRAIELLLRGSSCREQALDDSSITIFHGFGCRMRFGKVGFPFIQSAQS